MTLHRPGRWRARQRYWRERRCSGADVAKALALGGPGYLLVGSDGGVFTFGTTRIYGSLPGIGKHVHDIRAILPSPTGRGYILVGADGGAFNFGTGAKFHGSLPGEGVKVSDIVGIALTPAYGRKRRRPRGSRASSARRYPIKSRAPGTQRALDLSQPT